MAKRKLEAADSPAKKGREAKSSTIAEKPAPESERAADQPPTGKSFQIVGFGASAGGLEAFSELLKHLPTDTGMGFVFVQHMDPKHESLLTQLLSGATRMPVSEAQDGMAVKPNHVYVSSPTMNTAILHGILHLLPRTPEQRLSVDYFFRSLAADQGNMAIGVVLSGTASDGTLGLQAIKAEGGITFAQSEESAKYRGMPHSAIYTDNIVDSILTPEEIAKELAQIALRSYKNLLKAPKKDEPLFAAEDNLRKIFILIRAATGVDFTYYKQTSIKPRVARRMVLNKIDSLENYVKYLQESHAELDALYSELLIHVTEFFRDPETFQVLKEKIFPQITKDRTPETSIRLWVPGCSTGEETYSIAICLLEFLGDMATGVPIQVFGTDVSESAIEKARAGVYPESIAQDVSPERLRRFFAKVKDGYQISATIRNMCLFARQNVVKYPPFSNVDLISCRNVLIYLGSVLQKRVFSTFHYALKPNGFLLLGTSETIGNFAELFSLAEKKYKIYSKKPGLGRVHFELSDSHALDKKIELVNRKGSSNPGEVDVQSEADRIVLEEYAPPGVVINNELEILQFRGHTGPYLEPAAGKASFNLLKMAREGLLLELHTAIHEAKKTYLLVRKEGVRVENNGQTRHVTIEVVPLKVDHLEKPCFLILFRDGASPQTSPTSEGKARQKKRKGKDPMEEDPQVIALRKELATTKEYLQSIIEEQDIANEELQTANEELQSTNEELETAKEELQSINEELTTVNEELQNVNTVLSQVNDDLHNLLSNTQLAIVILGNDLRIRRFTPMAEKVLNLIPSDVGRPLGDIQFNIILPGLEAAILKVVDTLTLYEQEAQDRQGQWYLLRIRPYKTMENRIDGAVMTLTEIDALKRSMKRAEETHRYAQAIIETIRDPLLVLDTELRVKAANPAFYQTFRVSPQETESNFICDLGKGQWNIPALRTLLEDILASSTWFENFRVEHEFPDIGHRMMILNARRIVHADGGGLILLAIEDVTERKQGEQSWEG